MYLREKEVHQLILRLKGAFPHGCLVFDTIGSFGIKVLMKRTLKTMGIHGIKGMFYCNNPLHDLRLDNDIKVSDVYKRQVVSNARSPADGNLAVLRVRLAFYLIEHFAPGRLDGCPACLLYTSRCV